MSVGVTVEERAISIDLPDQREYRSREDAELDEALVESIKCAEEADDEYLTTVLKNELKSHYYSEQLSCWLKPIPRKHARLLSGSVRVLITMGEDEAKDRVKELLLEHEGSDDPITSREINEEINLDNLGSFPSTRAVIRELVLEDQLPIAATSQGYFIIQDENELSEYVDQLESRVMNITERKFAVQRAALNWDEGFADEDDDIL